MKYLLVPIESFQTGEVPEVVKKYIEKYPEPFIGLDESSKIKSNKACYQNKKSNRTRAILELCTVGQRAIMTGTFMSKSPMNAYDQMHFLKGCYFPETMWEFQRKYCILMVVKVGRGFTSLISKKIYDRIYRSLHRTLKLHGEAGLLDLMAGVHNNYGVSEGDQRRIMQNPVYKPFKNVDELYKRIEDVCMIVKKSEALDIPDKQFITRKVKPTTEMRKLYNELLKSGFVGDVAAKGIALYHRFQDVCNGYIPTLAEDDKTVYLVDQKTNPKIDELVAVVGEIDTTRSPVLVWSNRKKILKDAFVALVKEGYECVVFDGDTSSDEKKEIRKRFMNGEIEIFLGNQKSGGFGLDYLKTADYSIFICNDESVETRVQTEDRIHRGGIKNKKTIIDIVIEGSVDEKVMETLKVGLELINAGKTDKEVFEWKN